MFLHSYLQSNGYKPMPLDLTAVPLSEKMKELVEQLAENTHRVWASERIKLGWTYGLHDVTRPIFLFTKNLKYFVLDDPICLSFL